MSNPRLSIVIRCYNEEEHIGRLLKGVFEQTLQDFEVILVDSGSTDQTLAIASQFPARTVHIKKEDFSFGRSLNLGCEAARGEILVFASAHVYPVYTDWLERLTAPFDDTNVALSYGKQRGNHVTKYSEHMIFKRWFPDENADSQSHPFCNNANAAIRKSWWEKHRYDETVTGLEDLDWAKRVMAGAGRIAYVADAEVIHVHSETYGHIYNRYRREAIALKRIFPEERFSLWDFGRLLIGNTFSDYYHAAREGVFFKNIRSIPLFRLMQFWGTYRGYSQRGPVSQQLRQTFYYPNGLPGAIPRVEAAHARTRIEYGAES